MLPRAIRLEPRGHSRLKLTAGTLATCLLVGLATRSSEADAVRYSLRAVSGVHLHIIDVDLSDPRVIVTPAIPAGGIGRTESFSGFIRRLRPEAAINGTYFGKAALRPIGDIVIGGKLVHFGGMGTAVAFASDGVDFIRLPKSRHVDWSEHRAALAAGPLLVWDGFAKPMPGGEGFGDPSVFARAAPRTAVAVTRDNHLLLTTTARGTSLARLAIALRDLGAVYAMNLDGGSSTGMWYRNRMIKIPGRPLTNVLCVYVSAESAEDHALRAPRGTDWRGGHPPRPVVAFKAADLQVSALLPRRWEGDASVRLTADGSMPEGWTVSIWLDEEQVATSGTLPAEIPLDLSALNGPKHRIWIGVLDEDQEVIGRAERIFRLGDSGVLG